MVDRGVLYDAPGLLYDDPDTLYAPGDSTDTPIGEQAASFAEALALAPMQIDGAPIIDPWGVDENGDPCIGYLFCEAFSRVGTGAAYWDAVYWDDFYWAGEQTGSWVDVAPFIRSFDWKAGANSPLDNPAIGTCSIEFDNASNAFSAWGGGAFSFTARAGTLVRVGAYFNDVPKFFFTGLVKTSTSTAEFIGTTVLQLDELGVWLSKHNGLEQAPLGAHESLDDRINRLLTDCAWPGGYRITPDAIGDAFDPPNGTNLSENRWSEILKTADSVGMVAQVAPNGELCIRSEYPPYLTAVLNRYSNHPTDGALPIVSATMYASDERLLNVAIAASAGSTEQSVVDLGSVDQFGRSDGGSGSRDDLLGSDANTLAVLEQTVTYHRADVFGVEAVTLDSFQSPALVCALGVIADSGLCDRLPFSLSYEHGPSGLRYEATMVIDGMSMKLEAIGPAEGMRWTGSLSVATVPIALASVAVFDVSYFDTAVFGFEE